MDSIIIKSIIGLTILLAILSCIVVIFMKVFYHYQYLTINTDKKDNQDIDLISKLPILIAPIFIRDKDQENSNKDLAKLGVTIKNLLITFFCLLIYVLIVSQLL